MIITLDLIFKTALIYTVIEIRVRNWLATFFKDRTFHRLLIAIPLKIYSEIAGQNGFWLAKC